MTNQKLLEKARSGQTLFAIPIDRVKSFRGYVFRFGYRTRIVSKTEKTQTIELWK